MQGLSGKAHSSFLFSGNTRCEDGEALAPGHLLPTISSHVPRTILLPTHLPMTPDSPSQLSNYESIPTMSILPVVPLASSTIHTHHVVGHPAPKHLPYSSTSVLPELYSVANIHNQHPPARSTAPGPPAHNPEPPWKPIFNNLLAK